MSVSKAVAGKVNSYVRAHLTKILILAVILTAVLSMKYVAYGKYTSWLGDSTQAVAADFCFSSNLLKAPEEEAAYRISNWDKENGHTITIEMHNYDNSLRWNNVSTAAFYYLDAKLYKDDSLINLSDEFNLTIDYGTDKDGHPNEIGEFTRDGESYHVAYIPGMAEFDKTYGSQNVSITVKAKPDYLSQITSSKYYLKVNAYSIPWSEIKNIDAENISYDAGSNTITVDGQVLDGNTYAMELSALFRFGEGSPSANRKYEVESPTTEFRAIFKITTDTASEIKIYYDPDRITPSSELPQGTESAGDGTELHYVVHNARGGMERVYFYKKTMRDNVSNDIVDNLDKQNHMSEFYSNGEYLQAAYVYFPLIAGDAPVEEN